MTFFNLSVIRKRMTKTFRWYLLMLIIGVLSSNHLIAQPTIGTSDFNSNVGSVGFNQPTPFSTTIEGWTLTVRGATTAGLSNFVGVVNMTSTSTITSFDFASSDGSEFQLDNWVVRFNDGSMSGLTYTVTGFRDGGAVSGATFNATVATGSLIPIDVSSDVDFDNIDEFRLTFSGSPSGGISLDAITISAAAAANTAPVATAPSAPTVSEDALNVALADDIDISDTDGDDQTVTVTVTGGTVSLGTAGITFGGGGNGSANFTASGTLANINTALDAATFTPTADLNGTSAGSISFTSNDGTDDSNTASVTFDISAVNDDPTFTGLPSSITVTEDVSPSFLSNALSAGTFADIDAGGNDVTLTLSLNSGTFGFANPGGTIAISGNGTNNAMLTGTAANIETYLSVNSNVFYNPAMDVNGTNAATITLTANDGGNSGSGGGTDVALGTIQINITAVNDDPTIATLPTDISVVENTASDVNLSAATFDDVDAGSADVVLTIAAAQGTLSASSTADVTIGGSGTGTITLTGAVADIDAYLNSASNIQYTGPAALVGDDATTLTLTANDGGNTGTGGGTNVALGTVNVDIVSSDMTAPRVTSITRQNPTTSPTSADALTWDILFDEPVNNVTDDDFVITGTTATIQSVTNPSGNIYRVNISGGDLAGLNGTVTISFDGSQDITDAAGNALVNTTPIGTNDNTFVVENTAVLSIAATTQAAEDFTFGVFTITTSEQFNTSTTVNFTVGGTATPNLDYLTLGTSFTFPANTSAITLNAVVLPDAAVEGDETIILTMTGTNNPNVIIGTMDEATVTIADNDQAMLSIAATTQAVEDATNGLFTVTTDQQFAAATTVNITVGGTATGGTDYTSLGTSFVFPANQSSVTVPVSVIADNIVEEDETVIVTMTGTDNGSVTIGATDDATITITDNDVATLSIVATTQAAEDASDGLFTISTDNQFTTAVVVDFTLTGTATEGTDYATIGTQVTFPANQSTVTIPVDVIADAIIEDDETVILTITGTDNVDVSVGATDNATVTITDNDAATLSIVATTQAAEDATNGVFTISTNTQFTTDTQVTYTVDGTATSGVDYTDIGTTVVFPANTSSITITVAVIADELDEMDETVNVTLTGTDNVDVSIGTTDNASLNIVDDDETPVVTASQTLDINEDAMNMASVGTILATDTDAGTTFSNWIIVSGDTDGIFDLDASTGELTILDNTNLNAESTLSYTLAVTVSDGTNVSAMEDVVVNINDVNDVLPVVTSGQNFSVIEGVANNTLIGTLVASDGDVTATTFQDWMISAGNTSTDGDGNLPFSLNPTSGELRVNDTDDLNLSMPTFTLDITVGDGVNTSMTETVTVTVTTINDAPSFTAGADQTVPEDAGAQSVTGWATDILAGPADESGQNLTFNVSADNTALFDQQPAVSADGILTYTPATDQFGMATITISLSDDGGTANGGVDTSADQTFTIAVTSVNDAPSFTPGDDQEVLSGAASFSVPDWATNIVAGPANESSQVVTFNVSNDNNAFFTDQPDISTAGELTFAVADGAAGVATVTVTLMDDGGTANGGEDTSPEQTFTISIGRLSQTIVFGPIDDQRVGGAPVMLEATGGDSGEPVTFSITTTPAAGVATLMNNSVILEGVGTVTITASQAGNDRFDPAPDVSQSFDILANDLFLPSLFSPNNDGTNDLFLLRGGGNVAEISFSIFDREGNLVFSSTSFNELSQSGWDGRDQPQGAYVWVIEGTFSDGSPLLVNGENTGIIRLAR